MTLEEKMVGKYLTIAMVARNQLESTKKALESLAKYTDKNSFVLWFYDNGSTDGTEEWVHKFCNDNAVDFRYRKSSENRGYNACVNEVYDECETSYVLSVHNDVVFSLQWLERMMRRFKDPEVGAVGPVISFAMGQQSANFAYQTIGCDVNFLLGLFFLAETSAIRAVKLKFGEYLPAAYGVLGDKEELEFCYRLFQLGFRLEIARDVLIEHVGEKTYIDTMGSAEAFHAYQEKQGGILESRLGKTVVQNMFKLNRSKPVKLMVALLTRTEYIHYENMYSLLKLWGVLQRIGIMASFHLIARAHVTVARNRLGRELLKGDFSHIVFIDDDMVFDEDAIVRLLCMDVDIASGIAYQRGEPHAPCIFMFNPDTRELHPRDVPREKEWRGQMQVEAVGGYFMLIKRHVFEILERPWFVFGDTSLGINANSMADPDERGVGEDLYFSTKARMAGFDIFIDSGLEIRHIGATEKYDTDFYFNYRDSGKFDEAMKRIDEFRKM